jgi:hypothetical protein
MVGLTDERWNGKLTPCCDCPFTGRLASLKYTMSFPCYNSEDSARVRAVVNAIVEFLLRCVTYLS